MDPFSILWSPEAENQYLKIILRILERWTYREAEHFEAKVESLLPRLATHKDLCPSTRKQYNLRRCVITPQTSMVYRITGNTIEIVAFFDNRSDHKF